MQKQELKLLNFRNYERVCVSFDSNLNVIYGKNGSGKTNLVEAIYVLALTRSFKQINDKTFIRHDTEVTKIEGVVKGRYEHTYQVLITNDGKKVKVDSNKLTKLSDYISKIPIVLFNPNDLKMIKDTPSVRRKYLNIAISQLDVLYLKQLNSYNKLLKIRNSYLKQMYLNGNALHDYLEVVTEKLVVEGLKIYEHRRNYIAFINEQIASIYERIVGLGTLQVKYTSDYANKSKEQILEMYAKNLSRDLSFGKTNNGVHHDDICFSLDGKDLKDYGSEGQQKNAVISWKFSEMAIFHEKKEVVPILILDDLLSELDMEKINNILSFIQENVQTFITTTEIEKIEYLLEEKTYKKIHIKNGKLEEE